MHEIRKVRLRKWKFLDAIIKQKENKFTTMEKNRQKLKKPPVREIWKKRNKRGKLGLQNVPVA